MSEENRTQMGDGSDQYTQAAGQMAQAAKQFGQQAGKQAAVKSAEQTANAAAAVVKASAEGGKAAAEIAAGTAAGGPWGAVLSAAWSMRHSLYKVLICVCLCTVFFVVLILSLPTILTNSLFGLNGTAPYPDAVLNGTYQKLVSTVTQIVEDGYQASFDKAENWVISGGYDYDLSMEAFVNYGQSSAGYDVGYILSAYSVSVEPEDVSPEDMEEKLRSYIDDMFPVTAEEKTKDSVRYLACTLHPFNQEIIAEAFDLDLSAFYEGTSRTYEEVIASMAEALKRALYGSLGNGQTPPLTDEELLSFVQMQECNAARRHLLTTALSLVGKVPYFWGGKSDAGWNDEWNTPKLVTAAGSSETGAIRPYGLDCSGFTDWAFKTAFGISIGAGSWNQWDHTTEISEAELLPGDLGFLAVPGTVSVNHVLIFAGYAEDGKKMWVHCEGGSGVILSSPDYVTQYRRLTNIDFDTVMGGE